MARQPLVLLIPADRRTGARTRAGLEGYGYDVLMAGTVDEAHDLLRTNQGSACWSSTSSPRRPLTAWHWQERPAGPTRAFM